MKKLLCLLVLITVSTSICYARSNKFLEKCLNTWVGYSIDDVINRWGFPTAEREIAGRTLVIWQTQNSAYIPQSTFGTANSNYFSNQTNFHFNSYGGYNVNYYCLRAFEIDANKKIIGWQYEGNNCPIRYFTGKHLVNPDNDVWAIDKEVKRMEKEQKKLAKQEQKEQKRKEKEQKE